MEKIEEKRISAQKWVSIIIIIMIESSGYFLLFLREFPHDLLLSFTNWLLIFNWLWLALLVRCFFCACLILPKKKNRYRQKSKIYKSFLIIQWIHISVAIPQIRIDEHFVIMWFVNNIGKRVSYYIRYWLDQFYFIDLSDLILHLRIWHQRSTLASRISLSSSSHTIRHY